MLLFYFYIVVSLKVTYIIQFAANCVFFWLDLRSLFRSKQWSLDEVRNCVSLFKREKQVEEISSTMCKSRLSIKGKLFNAGLNSVEVATHMQRAVAAATAAATTPKGIFASLAAKVCFW
jgi:hypothetical protein